MSSVFFYTATIGFCVGIFARTFFSIGLPEITWIIFLTLCIALIGRRKSTAFSAPTLTGVSIFLFLFALGALRLELSEQFSVQPYFENRVDMLVQIEGVITREPDFRNTSVHVYVKTTEGLLLVTTSQFSVFSYGDRVFVEGMLVKPEAFETDLGRVFNYPGYLQAQGVQYMIRRADVSLLESGHGVTLFSLLFTYKHMFMDTIEHILPEPHAGLSEGLLLGVKRALGEDLERMFRKTGIIHIVVLSGYNIALVVAFVLYMFSYAFGLRTRVIFGAVAIVLFAILVGLSATVVRASSMAILLLVAQSTRKTYAITRALMFAGIGMLLFNPYLLVYDVGFQLSFLATLGLLLVAPHIEKILTFVPKMIGIREFLTATIATQIFVTPLLLYQIGELSFVSVIVNVLVLPAVPVAMFLTFITGIVGMVSPEVATFFGYLTYIVLAYILQVVRFFAEVPLASIHVPPFPFLGVVLAYAGMAYLLWKKLQQTDLKKETVLTGWVIEEEREVVLRDV